MKQNLSHVRNMFATYVTAKLAKGKSIEGNLFEVIAATCGLSKGMKSAVN